MMASAVATGNRRKSLTLRGVDPETCMIVFKNHWTQVVRILEKHEPGRGGVLGSVSFGFLSTSARMGCSNLRPVPIPADEASAVQNYVEHMLFLLMEEAAGPGGAMGPILELVVVEGVMERLFLWSLRRQFTEELKVEQLRMYQMLLSQARQPLLHHKAVLRPLMTLLASCAAAGPNTGGGGVVEAELVSLLNQLGVSLVRDPSVLELFFHSSEDQGSTNFLLFSLLIPYTHRQGTIGLQARESLLLIMSLSATEYRVAQHITDHTFFCPVLATGLSGLYSSLPAKLQVYSEDWFRLEREDWMQVPALVDFLNSLDFCNTVIKVAHPSIRTQLLGYIYNGFLVPVLAPALHKVTVEEVMTSTAYLELFLRCVSEPALLHTFLSFVLMHAHDNVHILDTLVSRINTPFQLGTVSLSLFRTLIGLFCEDVILQLVLRYLIPCEHLGVRERSSLAQRDVYSSCASSLLRLMPSWCPHTHSHRQHIHWPKGADADSVGFSQGCEFPMDVNYLHYLWDARLAVSTANRACLLWSAPYDGVSPPPRADEEEEDGKDEKEGRRRTAPSPPSTPSSLSSNSVAGGNRHRLGRSPSVQEEEELEWDDMAVDEEINAQSAAPPPARLRTPPPRHIQAMRRSVAGLLVSGGAYSEDTDFLSDRASTCDLVSTRDLVSQGRGGGGNETAILNVDLERDASNGRSTQTSVLEAVSSIMSTRRSEERRRGDEEGRREDGESLCSGETNVRTAQTWSPRTHHRRSTHAKRTANSHAEREPSRDPASVAVMNGIDSPPPGDDFLSQYRALMMSLGAEPEGDDVVADGMAAFRARVRALMEKQEEEEEGLGQDVDFDGWEREEQRGGEDGERGGVEEEMRRERRVNVPFTGPFLSVLLSRLENLLENSISVNLLLTGLLAQLASYPQPLLKAFLLNTQCQPNVRTLYQVLLSVRVQIEQYVSSKPECPAVITQAWRFLLAKDQHMKIRELLQSSPDDDSIVEPGIPPHGSRAAEGSVLPPCPPATPHLPPCPPIPPQARSRVFAVILYAEFLKELAAIAQEHSVAPPPEPHTFHRSRDGEHCETWRSAISDGEI